MLWLDSDDHYETGPIGEVLDPGVYVVTSRPYPMPKLRVVDPAAPVTD